ncbi:assembly factor cbp4 [Orbilia oligospora]|uniref:Cytochrome b mRNA-processing protein 4 n=1 Tax=Orbilia oligospora TaxID=2813651 RepID=A0A7C8NSM8_ORBOL|nr:assembly factor cbp4 [Orbilia oligospora]
MPSPRAWTYAKMAAASAVMIIGGPALVLYVMPSEEELFNKKVLEERPRRQREMQEFFDQLKEYSKSDKPIWVLQEEDAKRRRKEAVRVELQRQREEAARRASMLSEQLEGQIPSTGL